MPFINRAYSDGHKTLTILLGEGDVAIAPVGTDDGTERGVAFMPTEKGKVGRATPHWEKQSLEGMGAAFTILSTSKDSLLVLRGKIDEAIASFDAEGSFAKCEHFGHQTDHNGDVAITFCSHEDNPEDSEGNCRSVICPLKKTGFVE
jgi:hypothetical protein